MNNEPRKSSHQDNGDRFVKSHAVLGTAALFLGAALIFLVTIDATAGLPLEMPRFWYVNRPLWGFFALVFFAVGYHLLRQKLHIAAAWRAEVPGIRFRSLVLYSRQDCHLCEQAKDVLWKYASYLPEIREIDIDTDEELTLRFGNCVPVVEIDGRVRYRGRVNELLLRRLIEATPPLQ